MIPKILIVGLVGLSLAAQANAGNRDRDIAGAVVAGIVLGSIISSNNTHSSVSTSYSSNNWNSSISYSGSNYYPTQVYFPPREVIHHYPREVIHHSYEVNYYPTEIIYHHSHDVHYSPRNQSSPFTSHRY